MKTVALKWYDPVSYFEMIAKQPLKWSSAHEAEYQWMSYQFRNAENKNLFEKNPEKYAPAYNGYCATAMAEWVAVPSNPKTYMIHEDRLYVFFNNGFFSNTYPQRRRNMAQRISAADIHWDNKSYK